MDCCRFRDGRGIVTVTTLVLSQRADRSISSAPVGRWGRSGVVPAIRQFDHSLAGSTEATFSQIRQGCVMRPISLL